MLGAAQPSAVLSWREFGRPWDGDVPDWTTWVALPDDSGDALYRSLVVDAGTIVVTVDLGPGQGSGGRVIHRTRGELPSDPAEVGERVRAVLATADEATVRVIEAICHDRGGASARVSPFTCASSGRSDAWHDAERHIRERAYLLWEREGRPEGRAEEFWTRACREEARAA